jgi:hypothetical protein
MKRRTSRLSLLVCTLLFASCDRPPAISEYPPFVDLPFDRISTVPVILVGQIVAYSKVGRPRPSRWGRSYGTSDLMQLNRITVRVENVLQGNVSLGILPVYYFMNLRMSTGPPTLGMDGMGGTWHISDRELFFLQRDTDVLRTICDNFAHCVVPVSSGSHADANPDPSKPITERIVDLLLTRGKGCSDRDWLKAIEKDGGHAYNFDKEYTIKKLQILSASEMPGVRKQSCNVLATLGQPCAAVSRK